MNRLRARLTTLADADQNEITEGTARAAAWKDRQIFDRGTNGILRANVRSVLRDIAGVLQPADALVATFMARAEAPALRVGTIEFDFVDVILPSGSALMWQPDIAKRASEKVQTPSPLTVSELCHLREQLLRQLLANRARSPEWEDAVHDRYQQLTVALAEHLLPGATPLQEPRAFAAAVVSRRVADIEKSDRRRVLNEKRAASDPSVVEAPSLSLSDRTDGLAVAREVFAELRKKAEDVRGPYAATARFLFSEVIRFGDGDAGAVGDRVLEALFAEKGQRRAAYDALARILAERAEQLRVTNGDFTAYAAGMNSRDLAERWHPAFFEPEWQRVRALFGVSALTAAVAWLLGISASQARGRLGLPTPDQGKKSRNVPSSSARWLAAACVAAVAGALFGPNFAQQPGMAPGVATQAPVGTSGQRSLEVTTLTPDVPDAALAGTYQATELALDDDHTLIMDADVFGPPITKPFWCYNQRYNGEGSWCAATREACLANRAVAEAQYEVSDNCFESEEPMADSSSLEISCDACQISTGPDFPSGYPCQRWRGSHLPPGLKYACDCHAETQGEGGVLLAVRDPGLPWTLLQCGVTAFDPSSTLYQTYFVREGERLDFPVQGITKALPLFLHFRKQGREGASDDWTMVSYSGPRPPERAEDWDSTVNKVSFDNDVELSVLADGDDEDRVYNIAIKPTGHDPIVVESYSGRPVP